MSADLVVETARRDLVAAMSILKNDLGFAEPRTLEEGLALVPAVVGIAAHIGSVRVVLDHLSKKR
jgi:hypothetical protein